MIYLNTINEFRVTKFMIAGLRNAATAEPTVMPNPEPKYKYVLLMRSRTCAGQAL